MTRLKHFRNIILSPTTQIGIGVGVLMFISYAHGHGAYRNTTLLFVSAFIALFIPIYSKWSNRIEERIAFRLALVTPGRLGRFMAQWLFNCGIFFAFVVGNVLPTEKISAVGGIFGIAALTTASSQGFQYFALLSSNREIGNRNRNVLLALTFNVVLTFLATLGFISLQKLFLWSGLILGTIFFGIGLLSDLRSLFPKTGGVGVFFGTFNPIHNTHVEIIRRAIQSRNLSQVIVHATGIPKLHRDALKKGEISIVACRDGRRVYARTPRADVHVNYFPTGNEFYEFDTRCQMMELAIQEAGLGHRVIVMRQPELYESKGFYGVLSWIKNQFPNSPVHGIHGSDLGGMWVRGIYDESGWIYPYSVVRKDGVSATAIRKGAEGMTSINVTKVLNSMKSSQKGVLYENHRTMPISH
jgi:nicotinic acid mononucleotide adenylyltransferase